MQKLLIIILMVLFCCNPVYALQITSDANGPVTISEPQLKIGDKAPIATLTMPNFKENKIGGSTGKVQIISTIESFNTDVCDLQTVKFNQVATDRLKNVDISIVTANIPFIVDDFKTKHKITNINLLSSFRNVEFGKRYGVLVVGGELKGILARSVFVVDKNGKIVYKEITSNIDKMPNLDAAIKAAEKATNE